MDRVIKFRGKNALSGHWVYGFLTKKKNRKNGEIYFAIAIDDCSLANTIPVHTETVGQFTGLKDVADQDIYEGDILKDADLIVKVVWKNGHFLAYDLDEISDSLDFLLNTFRLKVIGNIFDNPELLEADENE